MDWCIKESSWKFESSMARESESSAKLGSSALSGKVSSVSFKFVMEPREERRRGVVGRERGREEERP